ncbi:alcohol dehydrogenase [Marinicauda pacifica]|uniref:Alcohol dehydrogenase 2 n=1 Tax=Marinicauda pacifica TaxID=1133559 RepID=A0A4S2H9H7_9PROT|nr:iron-containing alcohol dehydrogenase [Marinicauda pacifica]TGY92353.1 iron-containing alcohol dehydrogenase [Marinicauda pacifica]GGE48165.1 alcohol dehydrogenase [Marinicauda pacifica]
MTKAFSFRTVPHIVFEAGAAKRLDALIGSAAGPARKLFLLTDAGLRKTGLLDGPVEALKAAGYEVEIFDSVVADPPESVILEAVEAGRRFGAEAVIGFGGGSPMDTAKVVAVLLRGAQDLSTMYGVEQVSATRPPLILIPTTAGTGSEVTNVAVVTTGETSKRGIASGALYADMAILDPELTRGLPRHVTAATGIDAMVHAIEAFTNRRSKNPVSDALALTALDRLHRGLERACADGNDTEARGDMLLGAMLAGQAFSNSPCAGVHAMAYPLGGIFHVPHGLSNSVVLPPVLRFNASAAEDQYTEISAKLGLKPGSAGLIDEMERIAEAVGIERRLSQLGISHNDVPRMAEDVAANDRLLPNNPREMTYDDIVAMYEEIL